MILPKITLRKALIVLRNKETYERHSYMCYAPEVDTSLLVVYLDITFQVFPNYAIKDSGGDYLLMSEYEVVQVKFIGKERFVVDMVLSTSIIE